MTTPIVKVKPLEWGKDDCAEIMGLRYLLCDPSTAFEANGWYVLEETTNTLIEADGSPEAAKAAAQADCEARIRAELDTTDLEAHIGAVLTEAADAIADYPRVAPDAVEAQHYDEQIEHAQSIIVALRPDAVSIYQRKLREAREGGMRAALARIDARLHVDDQREYQQGLLDAMDEIDALIAAEKRIAQVPPGPTLIDTHGLPDDEGDDWDIRVGKPREAEGRGEGNRNPPPLQLTKASRRSCHE